MTNRDITADIIAGIDPQTPVLIAGPTASGKSGLALRIAQEHGGVIVNADAIQVYENWRVLTARPSEADEALAPHLLYGHIAYDFPYSVGDWLRDVKPIMAEDKRPIIVGGTGLYLTSLTEGLAEIPETPTEVRAEAMARLDRSELSEMVDELDTATRDRIDLLNPMRVQRAWEVLKATGRGLADWQDNTPPPLLPFEQCAGLLVDAPKDWLTPRIEKRFDLMLRGGALEEAKANLPFWSPDLPSAKAIGAAELIASTQGQMTLEEAREKATVLTRQYAKRQRTWFRARMRDWTKVDAQAL